MGGGGWQLGPMAAIWVGAALVLCVAPEACDKNDNSKEDDDGCGNNGDEDKDQHSDGCGDEDKGEDGDGKDDDNGDEDKCEDGGGWQLGPRAAMRVRSTMGHAGE